MVMLGSAELDGSKMEVSMAVDEEVNKSKDALIQTIRQLSRDSRV